MTGKQPPFLRCTDRAGFFHWPVAGFLLLVLAGAALVFEARVLVLGSIAVLSCLGTEAAGSILVSRQKYNWQDGQAVFRGLLLAVCLPPSAPLWLPVLAGFFGTVCGKIIFGGRSSVFFHPVLLAVLFAQACGWLGEYRFAGDYAPLLWWIGGLILARFGAVRLGAAMIFLLMSGAVFFVSGQNIAAEWMNPLSLLIAFLFLSEPGFAPGAANARRLYFALAGVCIGLSHTAGSILARDFAVLLLLRAMIPLFDLLLSRKPVMTRAFSTLSFYRERKLSDAARELKNGT